MLGGWDHRTSHRAAGSALLAVPPLAYIHLYARESVRRRKRSGHHPQVHPTGRPLFPFQQERQLARATRRGLSEPNPRPRRPTYRPTGEPVWSQGQCRHFQYDAAHILISEKIVASELLVVQHALHVEEERIAAPAREEAILAGLRHPRILTRRDRC